MHAETVYAALPAARQRAFEFFADIRNLPRWAPEFCLGLRERDGGWVVDSPKGEVAMRYVCHRDSGVVDIHSTFAAGPECLMPLRVTTTGTGETVILGTLFQPPGMPDAAFRDMVDSVRRDLEGAGTLLQE